MTIFIPKELKNWIKKSKPSEGDLLFVATIGIFAKMYGNKTFLEMDGNDIKSIIYDKQALLGISHLLRLQEEGVIQVINTVDGVESFRFHPDLKIGRRMLSNIEGENIEIKLKDSKAIGLCYYLLGRLAYVRVNGIEKQIEIIDNKYDASESTFGKSRAATIKKQAAKGKVSAARKYVRKKPIQNHKKTELRVIPHIYMEQLITKKKFIV
jgi:hypothetical protein